MGSAETPEREELVRSLYEAFNRGDLEAALSRIHPEMELRLAMEPVEPVVEGSRRELRGRDGARRFFELLETSWEEVRVEVKEIIEGAGDRLICFETWIVRGDQDIEVETELVDVYGFRDGLIASCDGFRDKNEALDAFGTTR
jgi:ketosteroid isomerase-like protein